MNLQEFVKDVLVSLDKAVEEARAEMKRDVYFSMNKEQRTVEFDIAVSSEETDSKNGKAGIKVLQFAEGGGSLSKENKNSTISRVKFGVGISYNTKDESIRQTEEYEAAKNMRNSSRP
ncbi:MAG: hypothetical protein HN411_00305 [Waddliaceae bacterium]|jgi:hypothetical protein|nr:hypothetical protein [Waddliaceae bacterium]MBT6928870.1 hypothetical protein [Waddliaceae bacterium]